MNNLPYPELNDEEQRLAERMWMIYDMFCRFHDSMPDWYYQWDKANALGMQATAFHNTYRLAVGSDPEVKAFAPPKHVDAAKVKAWLGYKLRRNHPGIGALLFPEEP